MKRIAWIVVAVAAGCGGDDEPTPDAAPVDAVTDTPIVIDDVLDPCTACTSDQICVQAYDGTCGGGVAHCETKTVACPNNACSTECQAAYCTSPYQCSVRSPCGGESPLAFTCYGP